MKTSDNTTINDQTLLLCEYAVMPFADCFCLNITGRNIPKIAKYCMQVKNDCPVYEKNTSGKQAVNRRLE